MREFTAAAQKSDEGRKIKYFLRGTMQLSHRQLSAVKAAGTAFVNGISVHMNHILHENDIVRIVLDDGETSAVRGENLPVSIVYEDEDIIIIDKNAPLACQCTDDRPVGTLENRLAWRYRDQTGFVFRPINRLDRGTSGLMAAAKNAHACRLLQNTLHTPRFVREYLAVTEGCFSARGKICLPIGKADGATVRREVRPDGRECLTSFETILQANGRTLVRLRLFTGRTHQIRVHMSAIGHPVSGDFLYGREIAQLPGRFALHSHRIELVHPISGEVLRFESPLPRELERLFEEKQI